MTRALPALHTQHRHSVLVAWSRAQRSPRNRLGKAGRSESEVPEAESPLSLLPQPTAPSSPHGAGPRPEQGHQSHQGPNPQA